MIQALLTTLSWDAIVVINEQSQITEWNQAAQNIFQYSREEALGQYLHQLITPSCFAADVERGFSHFHKDGAGALVGKVTEMTARRRDGLEFPIELSISAVKAEDCWCAIGIMRDMSEHKRVEAELIAAKELAEDANKAKSQFLARVGHELLTPLNAIIGFAQVMEMSADDEVMGSHRDSLNTIMCSGWQLHRIIKELLNLSDIESGKVELHIEAVDAHRCIQECRELIAPLACEYGIELNCNCHEFHNVILLADPFRLHEVITKLLDNAIKYNRAGGSISLSGQHVQGHLRILVSDTGQGIAGDELASLFLPFSRLAQRSYNIEGGGVGLSIAKQLIELMNGTIGVESVLGQGSTFWIELPTTMIS